jgi:hypothetical protein
MEKQKVLKRIGLWVLIAGFSGFLIWGAVNRTVVRESNSHDADAAGQGYGRSSEIRNAEASESKGEAGLRRGRSDNALISGADTGSSLSAGRGSGQASAGGRGQFAASQNQTADHPEDWEEVLGKVLSVDETAMELLVSDAEILIIEGQSWRYAQELGFTALIGDEISVYGYLENDEFKIGSLDNTVSDQIVVLREPSGRPVWAGGGLGRSSG